MAGRIARALEAGLRIRPGEQRRVALMSLYAANAIGAVVVGHSVRDALYLANRPARGLAGMYIWSSLAIVLVSWMYARIADRVPRGLLNAASALGCAALAAAFWAVLAQAGPRVASAAPLLLRSRPVRKARLLSRAGLSFLSSRHLTIVALIGAISAAAITIVDFQFKLSAAAVMEQDDLAGYFGRF